MASLQAIAKAQATGLAMQQVFGVTPDYDYQLDYVRVFYTPDKLVQVQQKINSMSKSEPGDVRVDWLPMVQPTVTSKIVPYALATLITGYLIGKIL